MKEQDVQTVITDKNGASVSETPWPLQVSTVYTNPILT